VPVIHHRCEAHYADFLSLFLSLSFVCVAPASRMDPKTYARGAAAKEWSLKTHYRTLCRSFTFPSPARRSCSVTATHRVSANQADRFETDRSYRPFNYFAISDPRTWARIFVPEDRASRKSFDCTPVRSSVSVLNYFCLSFEPLRLCYRYQEILCNYTTWLFISYIFSLLWIMREKLLLTFFLCFTLLFSSLIDNLKVVLHSVHSVYKMN